ncbi:THAP domain-containing protein 1, partial [Stegodyphus mimosarum]
MPSCAVYGCSNTNRKTKGTGIRYFSFPNNPDLINKWLIACKRKDKVNVKYACVCSQHFNANSYHITMRQRLLNYVAPKCRILKPDAVPTENLPSCVGDKKARTDLNATSCLKSDSQKVVAIDLFKEKTDEKQVGPIVVHVEPVPDIISATLNMNQHAEIEHLKLKIEQLEKENNELKVKVDQLSRKNKFILR